MGGGDKQAIRAFDIARVIQQFAEHVLPDGAIDAAMDGRINLHQSIVTQPTCLPVSHGLVGQGDLEFIAFFSREMAGLFGEKSVARGLQI